MNISKSLQQEINRIVLSSRKVMYPNEVWDLLCAVLDESYLIKHGSYIPEDMDEKYAPGYAEAVNDQHKRICEIKKTLKEILA